MVATGGVAVHFHGGVPSEIRQLLVYALQSHVGRCGGSNGEGRVCMCESRCGVWWCASGSGSGCCCWVQMEGFVGSSADEALWRVTK